MHVSWREDAAGSTHRHPLPAALSWTTRHLLFAALFFSFCLVLGGVALGCYLMIQRDFRWRTYQVLQNHVQDNWQPRPIGSFLLMPSQGKPNWLRLSNDQVSVRFYDQQLQRKVQMGGPPEGPDERPLQLKQSLRKLVDVGRSGSRSEWTSGGSAGDRPGHASLR